MSFMSIKKHVKEPLAKGMWVSPPFADVETNPHKLYQFSVIKTHDIHESVLEGLTGRASHCDVIMTRIVRLRKVLFTQMLLSHIYVSMRRVRRASERP